MRRGPWTKDRCSGAVAAFAYQGAGALCSPASAAVVGLGRVVCIRSIGLDLSLLPDHIGGRHASVTGPYRSRRENPFHRLYQSDAWAVGIGESCRRTGRPTKEDLDVHRTEDTPNPATLKFLPGREVMGTGTAEFSSKKRRRPRLGQRLFEVDGVTNIFLGADFITVAKREDKEWYLMKPAVLGVIVEHFVSGAPVMRRRRRRASRPPGGEGQRGGVPDQGTPRHPGPPGGGHGRRRHHLRGFRGGVVWLHAWAAPAARARPRRSRWASRTCCATTSPKWEVRPVGGFGRISTGGPFSPWPFSPQAPVIGEPRTYARASATGRRGRACALMRAARRNGWSSRTSTRRSSVSWRTWPTFEAAGQFGEAADLLGDRNEGGRIVAEHGIDRQHVRRGQRQRGGDRRNQSMPPYRSFNVNLGSA